MLFELSYALKSITYYQHNKQGQPPLYSTVIRYLFSHPSIGVYVTSTLYNGRRVHKTSYKKQPTTKKTTNPPRQPINNMESMGSSNHHLIQRMTNIGKTTLRPNTMNSLWRKTDKRRLQNYEEIFDFVDVLFIA